MEDIDRRLYSCCTFVILSVFLSMGVTRSRQGMSELRLRAGDDRWPRKISIKNLTANDNFAYAA